jgi:hypothetical protein
MEQQLDARYLNSGPFERATAIGIGAVAIGTGILLAAWGVSLLWRFTPPEIGVRIANPEVHITQDSPLTVSQREPFKLESPRPLKIEPGELTIKTEQPSSALASGLGTDTKTATGDVIQREVTVFSNVRHGPGTVVTGWRYSDGSSRVPVHQYCYYTTQNVGYLSNRVDIASNHIRSSNIDARLVPDLEGALARCQWWQG